MKLIYQGKGEYIHGVPARDLSSEEVQRIATDWGKSLAETEGLLIQRGLYKAEKAEKIEKVKTPKEGE